MPETRPKAGARNQPGMRVSGGSYKGGNYRKRVSLLRDAHGLVGEMLRNEKLKKELAGIGKPHDIVKYFSYRLYPKKHSLTKLSDKQLLRLCKVEALILSGKIKINEIRQSREPWPPYIPMEEQIEEIMKAPEPISHKDGGCGNVITLAAPGDIQRLLTLFNELGYNEEQRKRFINLHTGKYTDAKQIRSKAQAQRLLFELGKVKAGREKHERRTVQS